MGSSTPAPRQAAPSGLADLAERVAAIAGRTLADLAADLGEAAPSGGLRTKGKVGELVERVLGATGGSHAMVDFPDLGVELKTLPIDARGRIRESTFVCAVQLLDAERADWRESWVRAKLAHVLWLPIVDDPSAEASRRRVGRGWFWRPDLQQERGLAEDFEELMGTIGVGGIESVTAHQGRWLQIRPKAASGRSRTIAFGADGERIETVPRGFYLRTRFTQTLLRDEARP